MANTEINPFAYNTAASSEPTIDPSVEQYLSSMEAPSTELGPVSEDTAGAGLPAEANALLKTISGTESPDYHTIYGGQKVQDLRKHPSIPVTIKEGPNAGKTSTAAGKYQFLKGTWEAQAAKLGLTDFSPKSQDLAAWNLAQETYAKSSNRDLLSDLKSRDSNVHRQIAKTLAPIWTSLPGGIEQGQDADSYISAYNKNLGGDNQISTIETYDIPLSDGSILHAPKTATREEALAYAKANGITAVGLQDIHLASGDILHAPENVSVEEAIAQAKQFSPDMDFTLAETGEPGRFGAALARSGEGFKQTLQGIGLGTSAALDGEDTQAKMDALKAAQAKEGPGPKSMSVQDIQDIYSKDGAWAAAKELPGFAAEKVLESSASTAAPLAAGLAAGAVFPPAAIPVGIATAIVQQFGDFIGRQAQENMKAGELDPGNAIIGAIPAGVLDFITDKFTLGLGMGAKQVAKTAALEEIKKSVAAKVGTHAVKGAIVEPVTEVGQQAIERAQAKLPVTGEEAGREYKEAAGTALAAGTLQGAVGGANQALQERIPEPDAGLLNNGQPIIASEQPITPEGVPVQEPSVSAEIAPNEAPVTEEEEVPLPGALAAKTQAAREELDALRAAQTDTGEAVIAEEAPTLRGQWVKDVFDIPDTKEKSSGIFKKLKDLDIDNPADHVAIDEKLQTLKTITQPQLAAITQRMDAAKAVQPEGAQINANQIPEATTLDVSGGAQSKILQEGQGAPISGKGVREGGPETGQVKKEKVEPFRYSVAQETKVSDKYPNATPEQKARLDMTSKQAAERIDRLTEGARQIERGEITHKDYQKLVDENKPVTEYNYVPKPEEDEDMWNALEGKDKKDKLNMPIEEGKKVNVRLDIPAYTNNNAWVPTIHEGGKSIAHRSTAIINNVTMQLKEKSALLIATRKMVFDKRAGKDLPTSKKPIATMEGAWENHTPEQAYAEAKKAMDEYNRGEGDWVQVGMDPERHSFFYDRKTQQPITSADRVVQVGPLVLAKNAKRGDKVKEDYIYSAKATPEATKYTAESLMKTLSPEMKRLVDSGKAVLHDTAETLPAGEHPENVQGLTTAEGVTHYVANKLTPETIQKVALHEVGVHAGMEKMVGAKTWGNVKNQAMTNKGEAFDRARAAVPKNTPEHLKAEETLAYLVENSPELPIVKRLISSVRNFARVHFGANLKLTEADARDLAISALRRESKTAERTVREGTAYAEKEGAAPKQRPYISDETYAKEVKMADYPHEDKTRSGISIMTPDQFLSLVPDSNGNAEKRADKYGAFDAHKFADDILPALDIDAKGKVQNHEGRARAIMAKRAGITEFPVIVRLQKTDRVSYGKEIPSKLTAQENESTVAIPKPAHLNYKSINPLPKPKTLYSVKQPSETNKALGKKLADSGLVQTSDKSIMDSIKTGFKEFKASPISRHFTRLQTSYIDSSAGLRSALSDLDTFDMNGKLRADMLHSKLDQIYNIIRESFSSGPVVLSSDGGVMASENKRLALQSIFKRIDALKHSDPRGTFFTLLRVMAGEENLRKDVVNRGIANDAIEAANDLDEFAKKVSDKVKYGQLKAQAVALRKEAKKILDRVGVAPEVEGKRLGTEKLVTKEQIEQAKTLLANDPDIAPIMADVHALLRASVDLWEKTGLVNKDVANEWRDNPAYIPLYKSMDELSEDPNEYIKVLKSGPKSIKEVQRLEGGTHAVNVGENLVKHVTFMTAAAAQNQYRKAAVTNLSTVDDTVKQTHPNDKQAVMFKVDGKKVFYHIDDPLVLEALETAMPSLGAFAKVAQQYTKVFRATTLVNPLYWYRQVIRDPIHANLVSQTGIVHPGQAMVAMAQIIAGEAGLKSKTFKNYEVLKRQGVVGAVDSLTDPKQFVKALASKPGAIRKSADWVMRIHEAADAATRVIVYEAGMKEATKKGLSGQNAENFAAMRAREIINFSKKGNSQAIANIRATVPFFSSALNSMDTLARAATGAGLNKKEAARAQKMFVTRALVLASVSAAWALHLQDDDDYIKSPDWANSWLVPTGLKDAPFWKIPIPFEAGFFFKVLPELMVRLVSGTLTPKEAKKEAGKAAVQLLVPPLPLSQILKPALETVGNYDSFTGRPIESVSDLSKTKEQRDSKASDLAKFVSQATPLSPNQIEHLGRGYFTELWSTTAALAENYLHKGPAAPEKHLGEMPFIRGVLTKPEQDRTVNKFYEVEKATAEIYNTVKGARKTGEKSVYEDIMADPEKAKMFRAYPALNSISDRISKLRKNIERIKNDASTTPSEKTNRIRNVQQQINKAGEQGVATAKRMKLDM